MIVGTFLEMLSRGGVQRLGLHTAASLAAFASARGLDYRFFSLADEKGFHEVSVGNLSFTFRGFGMNKVELAIQTTRYASRAKLVFLAHPNLSPLGVFSLKPYCVYAYGIDVWKRRPFLVRKALKRARLVAALSRYTRDQLITKQGVSPERIFLLNPPVDPQFLSPNGGPDSSAETAVHLPGVAPGKTLLTVARLSSADRGAKGVETVFDAMRDIIEVVPEVRYVIAGDGDDRIRLQQIAASKGLGACVFFTGRVSDEKLIAYYRACDIFVMPARSEGFGIVFVEASALGKPVIAASIGGATDAVVDGTTGFLVDANDAGALAKRVICLLTDPNLRQTMGLAGQQRVRERYSFAYFARKMEQALSEAFTL